MHIEASDKYKLILGRLKTLAWAAMMCAWAATFSPHRSLTLTIAMLCVFALVAFIALGGVQILIGLARLYLPLRRARTASSRRLAS